VKHLKKEKGFSLVSTIIIIVITAIISGITTGVIMYSGYRQSTGLSYSEISNDLALQDFLEVYSSILDDYYEDIDRSAMLEKAVSAMMDYLGDTYTTYLTEEETKSLAEKLAGEYKGIGITIQDNEGTKITDVAKNSPAYTAGLLVGDVVKYINDEDVSNYGAIKISSMIKNSNMESVKIGVMRNEELLTFELKLSKLFVPAIASEVIEENNKKIGYIFIDTFSNTLAKQMEEKLNEFKEMQIDSLIIDVRDNSGGYLSAAEEVASLFLKKGSVIYSLEDKEEKEIFLDETDYYVDYKTIVLINKNSASASEILAAALKDSYGATLLGEKSYGKGKVQQTLTLKDGSMVKYTSARWLTPLDKCIDGIGLNPDYEILNEYVYADDDQKIITDIIDKQKPKAIEILTQ